MSDLISRENMKNLGATCLASRSKDGKLFPIVSIDELPSVQPKEYSCDGCIHQTGKQINCFGCARKSPDRYERRIE